MATPVAEVVKINWKQVCPWLALFRTFGMALHVRQIFVGAVAAGLISLGQWCLIGSHVPRFYPEISVLPGNFQSIWAPLLDVVWPLFPRSIERGILSVSQAFAAIALVAWALVIGGLAGGILCRRAAFEFAREESLSLRDATRYVWSRSLDYLSAPALPLSMVFVMGLLLALAGWIAGSGPAGSVIVAALWLLVLAGLLAMAVLLVASLAGWPMMVAAVSINGGDGFDALSRGFGFVIDRWRYYAWCAIVMTVYGSLGVLLIYGAVQLVAYLSNCTFHLGAGPDTRIPQLLPAGVFFHGISLLIAGLGYSYFWSSMTIIYLVLRKSVDNAQLQDIYVEGASPTASPTASPEMEALLNPQASPGPTLLPIIDPPQGG